ncbi:MAG: hypothetical protein JWN48_3410 [Myxococcaceae bacterium]|nr:hypothetical protein [Myxococcaceae bacterium]
MGIPSGQALRVATAFGAVCAYALVLLGCPPPLRPLLASCALSLPVLLGWFCGGPAGLVGGGLLALLHLGLLQAGMLAPMTALGLLTFALGQLLALAAGAAAGQLHERLQRALALEQTRAERYLLAARGSDDGLWDWDLATKRVYRSPRWRQIAQLDELPAGSERGVAGFADEGLSPLDLLTRVHPEDVADARAELEAHLRGESDRYEHAHRIRRSDGTWRWVLERGMALRDAAGKPYRMAGLLSDIDAHKESEERLRHHAFHDALTGLPNRALFMDRVQHAVARARRAPTSSFAVLMLDLDRFKNVNDSLGHAAGDRLLNLVAERIGACIRDGDTVARLGGDEFSVLLEELPGEHEAERVAENIQRALSAPLPLDGHDLVTSASIGIVLARDDAFDSLSLLRRADQAMYAAKKQGRGRQVLFEASAHSNSSLRLTLETSLRTALSEGQLRVYFQPIVNLASGEATGFEALVRWPHPKLGLISPAELVPVAEESGAIVQLGDFVLHEALRALHRLDAAFRPSAPFTMAVNLSSRELARDDLVSRVELALERAQVAPTQLVLEVKESALMGDADAGQAAFRTLRARGVRVHMDDFGTGYSSLSYLHKFPVDALKIDGSFTSRLHDNLGAEEIVRTVITIARDLHLGVVAEGVENREQLQRLRALGCHEAQGFLFGAPLPLEALEALLRRGPKLAVA